MATIVIKKTVKLDFLGEDYKDDYLTFKAIPIKDYDKIVDEIESLADDSKKSLNYIRTVIPEYFLEGMFGGEEVKKSDLDDFDQETYLKVFQRITGQVQDENLSVG